ncbi:MAG: 4a-hydroxytetrahydrobiopterin dehydratase [Candidatus Promineifilaceae bacterium]
MSRRKVSDDEVAEALKELPGWKVKDGKLHKNYKFGSFAEALGWMVSVGVHADKMDHHPDWCNGYNKVEVNLMTHDLGALSTYDLELAAKMEELAG